MTTRMTNEQMTGSGMSRRTSLLTLGGTALAATLARPLAAGARKTRKKCNRSCKKQGDQCRTKASNVCAGAADPATCQQFFLPLCDALGRCNAEPLLDLVVVLS